MIEDLGRVHFHSLSAPANITSFAQSGRLGCPCLRVSFVILFSCSLHTPLAASFRFSRALRQSCAISADSAVLSRAQNTASMCVRRFCTVTSQSLPIRGRLRARKSLTHTPIWSLRRFPIRKKHLVRS